MLSRSYGIASTGRVSMAGHALYRLGKFPLFRSAITRRAFHGSAPSSIASSFGALQGGSTNSKASQSKSDADEAASSDGTTSDHWDTLLSDFFRDMETQHHQDKEHNADHTSLPPDIATENINDLLAQFHTVDAGVELLNRNAIPAVDTFVTNDEESDVSQQLLHANNNFELHLAIQKVVAYYRKHQKPSKNLNAFGGEVGRTSSTDPTATGPSPTTLHSHTIPVRLSPRLIAAVIGKARRLRCEPLAYAMLHQLQSMASVREQVQWLDDASVYNELLLMDWEYQRDLSRLLAIYQQMHAAAVLPNAFTFALTEKILVEQQQQQSQAACILASPDQQWVHWHKIVRYLAEYVPSTSSSSIGLQKVMDTLERLERAQRDTSSAGGP